MVYILAETYNRNKVMGAFKQIGPNQYSIEHKEAVVILIVKEGVETGLIAVQSSVTSSENAITIKNKPVVLLAISVLWILNN
jgi:hypothetical protein